jgi:Flp pilus assembly protein TadD
MSFRHVLGAALAIVISVVSSPGQIRTIARPTYSIHGTVRDDRDQHVMENVRVEIKAPTGTPINSTFTRGNGEFEFTGLYNGEYIIEVAIEGYELVRKAVTITNSAYRGLSLTLTRPMRAGDTSSSGAVISVHQLRVPRRAREEFEKALQLAYVKSDYRGAILQFQRAIKDFPAYYEAYAQEGSAYLDLHELAPAETLLRKSIELSSGNYSDPLFMLAGVLSDTNRYSEAESVARRVIALDPASWHGPYELARALAGLKQFEQAEKSALQARDLRPDNPPVYLILTNIHIQRRDFPAIQKDLDTYLKLAPTGPAAEQARKIHDQLQAAMQEEEKQARANPPDFSPSGAQNQDRVKADDQDQEQPEPDEPDAPFLPPLPPAKPDN